MDDVLLMVIFLILLARMWILGMGIDLLQNAVDELLRIAASQADNEVRDG